MPFICINIPSKDKERGKQLNSFEMMIETTKDAILTLKNIDFAMNQQLTVNVTKPQKLKDNYQVFILSDGTNKFKGIIEVSQPSKNLIEIMKKRKTNSITIVINQHITHFEDNEPMCIEVVAFSNPQQKNKRRAYTNNNKISQITVIQTPLQRTQQKIIIHDPQQESVQLLQKVIKQNLQTTKQSQERKLQLDCKSDEQQTIPDQQVTETKYHSIIDLYQQFYNWQIIVRVIDVSFREFTSKMGKPTKILTLQLIDQHGYMITGCYFGHYAVSQQNAIKNGKIYKISKGKVSQDKYNKRKRQKQSKFTLVFTKDTQFQLVNDHHLNIPHCTNNWLRLSQINQFFNTEEDYNFVCLLLQIQQEREIERQDKKIKMQSFKIGDPITKIVYQAINWNNQIKIDPKLVQKSVLLKKFKVTRFKDQVTLNSTFKSEIVSHSFFCEHEGKNDLISKGAEVKTISEISQQLHNHNRNIAIVSQIQCWIKQIGFDQKWFYDACPNPRCKKACTNYTSRCEHCLFEFYQCHKKFILQVKLVDLTGSIWVTAFDQSANVILKNTSMESLFPMTNKQLCEYAASMFCYQQYRIQISSKMDQLGKMKHIISGKPTKISIENSIKQNLKAIKSLSNQLNIFQAN